MLRCFQQLFNINAATRRCPWRNNLGRPVVYHIRSSRTLSLCWRQWRSRYTIHAGRNLPDKEFRYLWTVRVTAAVYWSLKSKPQNNILNLQHRAGVSPYTSFYKLAETCVFIKQSLPPSFQCQLKRLPQKSHPFSRSYRAILPSSFNKVLSSALVYSTYPPVSVSSTVLQFLWKK